MKPHLMPPAEMLTPESFETEAAQGSWLIVTQYKSDRVVYFTDDAEFDIPTQADWCYVSPHAGALPDGMTLRNCWGWRYRGFKFIDARKATGADRSQTLLDNNKDALRKLLKDKIEALRKPVLPSNALGSEARAAKLVEAQLIVAGGADPDALPLLPAAAAVRNLSLQEMAELVLERAAHTRAVIAHSELAREEISVAIQQAATQEALGRIRSRLLGDLAPELGADIALKPEHTTPEKLGALPTPSQLRQERLRLQVKLRLRINELRRPQVSAYLLDEEVLRHKSRLARLVQAAGGAVPPGIDLVPLISHAAGRGLTLAEAATDVLADAKSVETVLLVTEQMKDAVLARVADIKTFKDAKAVGRMIDQLSLPPARGDGS